MNTREDYRNAFQIVRSVIAEWDPFSLILGGAPTDEFDGEVTTLLTCIRGIHNSHDAAAAVSSVFSASFEPEAFPLEACSEVGAKLFARLSEAGLVRNDA